MPSYRITPVGRRTRKTPKEKELSLLQHAFALGIYERFMGSVPTSQALMEAGLAANAVQLHGSESQAMAEYKKWRSGLEKQKRDHNKLPLARARLGEKEDIARVVNANMRLVSGIAKKMTGGSEDREFPFSDAVTAGTEGLLKAISQFDFHQGNQFSTYATWWVRRNMDRARRESSIIRLPHHVQDELQKLEKAEDAAASKAGRIPTDSEVAEMLGHSVERVRLLRSVPKVTASLNKRFKASDEGQGSEMLDSVQSRQEPAEKGVEFEMLVAHLTEGMSGRRKEIFTRHVLEGEPISRVAEDLGIQRKAAQAHADKAIEHAASRLSD